MLSFMLLLIPLLTVVVLSYICIYNLFFHPLRFYPGPFLARATRLWNIYHDLRGDFHIQMRKLHENYGEVVRFAPNELSFNTGKAWLDIYGHRNSAKMTVFEKDPVFYTPPANGVKNMVTALEHDHCRMRRLQSHAFSDKALTAQEGIIMHHINTLISELHKQISGPDSIVDMNRWYDYTTFDIIGDLALGQSFNSLTSEILRPYVKAGFDRIKFNSYMRITRRFPSPLKECLLWLLPKNMESNRESLASWAAEKARERMIKETERGDFLSYIMRANNSDEKRMTPAEIESTVQNYLSAGSETTATLLAGATFYLLSNPRVLNTLVAEIQKNFDSENQITMHSTRHLPYLHAVLEEALRLFPPTPNIFPRVTPFPGEMICGKFVPGGTTVGVHQWACFRSARNFTEPDTFIPERFLSDPRFKNDDKFAFQPFSYGSRNCLGKNLAYAEMRIIIARILWNFKMELQPDSYLWNKDMKTFFMWEKPKLNVKLTPSFMANSQC